MMQECYQCGKFVHDLSPRSRCVICEYKIGAANALENADLRAEIAALIERKEKWRRLAYKVVDDARKTLINME